MTHSSTRLVLAPDVVLQLIDGDAILLKLTDETVFALNATGARVVDSIREGMPLDAAIAEWSVEYGRDKAAIASEVTVLVDALRARGLVVEAVE